MSGIDVITELKPPIPIVPPIEAPTEVLAPIVPEVTSDTVSMIEDGLVGKVPPEDIISDLASGPDVDTTRPITDGEASLLPATPEAGSSEESSDVLDLTEISDEVDRIEEEYDSSYPEPEVAEDPLGHFKWLKQKMNTMESSLIEKAVNKRLEHWEKKNPAPSTENKEAYKEWSDRRNQEEQKIRDTYEKYSDRKERKEDKKKSEELNEAQILKLVNQLRSKSMISADYAQAIAVLRTRPPTPESKLQIAEFQRLKQTIDNDITRINQLLTGEVAKANWMKKIRLMALIAGAAVIYGTFKSAKAAEQPAQ
ncbi:MAG: hypothetical protein AABX29_03450 [Nanoarchaeota archaeon]